MSELRLQRFKLKDFYRLVGLHLQDLRIQSGIRQRDVAAWLDLHREAVLSTERGRRRLQVHELLIALHNFGRPLEILPGVHATHFSAAWQRTDEKKSS